MALNLKYRPIDEHTVTRGFACREKQIDRFFSNEALKVHREGVILTTCAYLPGILAPVGFYSLASISEKVSFLPGRYHRFGEGEHFPALQLVYLAVHYEHQDRTIGISMAGAVTELFAQIGPVIGLPQLILVPINENVIPFYEEQLGFTCYNDRSRMYLSLRDALDAMATPAASDTGDLFDVTE